MQRFRGVAATLLLAILLPVDSRGQSVRGGFVATLGADTVHVERFSGSADRIAGIVVVRTPAVRTVRWTLTFDTLGRPARYDAEAFDAAGTPVLNGQTGSMVFAGDTVIRTTFRAGERATDRVAATSGAYPGPGLPYIGLSYMMYENALRDARRRLSTSADSAIYFLTLNAGQTRPQRLRAWLVGPDSAELDYFGVARSGYKLDARGQLIRSDWTATTYRYRVARVTDIDVDAIARAWSDAERRGQGFGPLSMRDSVKASVGTALLTIDYSRPSRRGRTIWGDVVPWDKVWRLGADMATHFTTSADLLIGEAAIPAGRYTLWMIASEKAPLLIVSSAVNVFGTAYNPARDLTRIPLTRRTTTDMAERLTLSVRDGGLQIHWGDAVWSAPIAVK